MGKLLRFFIVVLTISPIAASGTGSAGVLKSLDEELTSLVEKTEPYLVTVKGKGPWKNLIATGIIYNKEGYLITSSHVYDADQFEVRFKDGETYVAKKTGVDRQSGLAVLKIDGEDLRGPGWGDASELKEGAWILVVGNSFGIPATVNFGILAGRTLEGFLQLGVDVSPGSSGGAVLDTDGKIVGVLIAVEADSEFLADDSARNAFLRSMYSGPRFPGIMRRTENRAVAVPAEQVLRVADQLIEFGEVQRGFLGISQKNLPEERRREYGIKNGILIVEVVADSPAERAGLKEGDIILAVGDDPVEDTADLYGLIRSHRPGDEVTILYHRDGEQKKTAVTLGKAEDDFLFGAGDILSSLPKIKADKRIALPEMGGVKEAISRLETEIDNIKKDIDKLRERLKD